MKLQKSLIAIFALLICVLTANAQFGDLLKKAQDKIDKKTKQVSGGTNINTNGGTTSANTNGNRIGGGCTAQPKSGPVIGTELIIEHTPGCPNFVGLSKSPIDPKNLKATQWATEFKSGDPIYGIVFVSDTLKQWAHAGFGDNDEISFNLSAGKESGDENSYFGGELLTTARVTITSENINQNYATFAFIPSPSAQLSNDDISSGNLFLEQIKRISKPAKLYASVTMLGWARAPGLAPIVLDLSGGTQSYLAMKGEFNKGMAKVLGADKVMMPAAGMKNPQLENKILAMENALPGKSKLLRVVITDREWTPLRHEISGVLIGRVIITTVAIKDEEGVCTLQPRSYTENYDGRNYTGLHNSGIQPSTVIACENVMK